MIHILAPERKIPLFQEYFDHWGREVSFRVRMHRYEQLPDRLFLEPGVWIFSDLDELDPAVLALVEKVHDGLVSGGVPVLNDPRRVLRRKKLLEALYRQGLNCFRAAGLDGDLASLRLPVFVRQASDHLGPRTPLIHTRRELDRWIGTLVAWGAPAHDLLVVEFLDTASASGEYRKYAAFVLGGRILPRSVNRSRDWMVKHDSTDFTLEFQEEELAYVEENPHREALAEVVEVAGIDYGRVDYAVLDGRVQTWEINLCPTIGRGARPSSRERPPEVQTVRRRAKERFYRDFADAWRRVDRAPSGLPIPAPFDPEDRERARRGLRNPPPGQHHERLRRVRDALKPFRPLLRPVWRGVVTPLLGRFVRR